MTKKSSEKTKFYRPLVGQIIMYIIIALAALSFVAARYKIAHFGGAKIDEIIFYIFNGLEGSNTSTFQDAFWSNLPFALLMFGLFCLPVIDFYRNKVSLQLRPAKSSSRPAIVFNPSNIRLRYKIIYAVVAFVAAFSYLLSTLSFYEYLKAQFGSTKIYETEYVDPEKVNLKFPDKKRNLVYVYLESMENTVASKENGGAADASYIPELENYLLDKNNISFSNTNQPVGGGSNLSYTGWTVGALTAQTAGIQLKNPIEYDRNSMGDFKKFIPGAYTLGDVLKKEGYNQTFMIGSDKAFGGRDKLFSQHGNFKIFDLTSAKEEGKIDEDYHIWWGYEDKKLFEYAKEEAVRLASKDEPFNLQLLTVDTHFTDGYLDETCPTPYEQKYLNVHACSSRQVYDFVEWIKTQPFFENTTVVVAGDHLGMQTEFYERMIGSESDYRRTIYNLFINSTIDSVSDSIRYDRIFSTMDMYPTTLAAIGVKIPGERLGLGTNLFSGEKTLPEVYGWSHLDEELAKRSSFYNQVILTGRK